MGGGRLVLEKSDVSKTQIALVSFSSEILLISKFLEIYIQLRQGGSCEWF
jgi:hypothetical protein